MGHSRAEGHKDMRFSTEPHDGVILTNAVTSGEVGIAGGTARFELGSIVGSLTGDLLLSVTFRDGERVTERLSMAALLHEWIGEVAHSKRMRDDYGAENV